MDECVFIRYVWNIKDKDSHLKTRSSDLDVLSSLVDVPEGNRVYPSCPHSITVMIVVHHVDNSGIRYNCHEIVDEFYAAVRDDGHTISNSSAGSLGGSACATPTILLPVLSALIKSLSSTSFLRNTL
jgi:hypothetical protein